MELNFGWNLPCNGYGNIFLPVSHFNFFSLEKLLLTDAFYSLWGLSSMTSGKMSSSAKASGRTDFHHDSCTISTYYVFECQGGTDVALMENMHISRISWAMKGLWTKHKGIWLPSGESEDSNAGLDEV